MVDHNSPLHWFLALAPPQAIKINSLACPLSSSARIETDMRRERIELSSLGWKPKAVPKLLTPHGAGPPYRTETPCSSGKCADHLHQTGKK